jgi:hypothetical protein
LDNGITALYRAGDSFPVQCIAANHLQPVGWFGKSRGIPDQDRQVMPAPDGFVQDGRAGKTTCSEYGDLHVDIL